jgi:pimeloyl-ACP methyl ester carboxylesterase
MPKQTPKNPADYITPLYMNRLRGRMLRLDPPKGKKREILLVYGHHVSLERFFGLAEALNDYGGVTMPDLPGFGGMDSFYKIGEKPTIDNFADYLAAFVRLRYKRRRVTIVGLSFGFVVVTRMLERYPDLAKKVDLLVSVAGFMHKDDFTFSKRRHRAYHYGAAFFSHRLPAAFYKNIFLHPAVLRQFYAKTNNARHKFKGAGQKEYKRLMDYEIHLWRTNDLRTQMFTSAEFLTLNNCLAKVDLPVWHVSSKGDNYFDNHVVEQHMRVVFSDFIHMVAVTKHHTPTFIANKKQAAGYFPAELRRELAK